MKGYLTTDEAAKVLRIAERTVRQLCQEGKIGASHPGRKWLIPQESLDDYLKIRR